MPFSLTPQNYFHATYCMKVNSDKTVRVFEKVHTPAPAFACSKLVIKTLEQDVKYVQS